MGNKKVVIFYSKTGGGHLRTAQAIAEKLKQINKKLDIKLLDVLEQTNFGFKLNLSRTYGILSIRLLPLYNLLYGITDTNIGIKTLRFLIKHTWGHQYKKLIEYEKPDVIITTHSFISPSVIHTLEKKYKFITVVTDLGKPHRIWFDKKSDKIITPTPKITKLAKILLKSTDDQIIHLGFPLQDEFKPSSSKGFTNTILIMGGGLGAGRIEKQVKLLSKKMPDEKLIAVCGLNTRLYNKLSKMNKFSASQIENKSLSVYQFVGNIEKLMAQSDIIITKAGPGTIIEAAQMQKPMIITDWVGKQEKENVNFVLENNLGVYCPDLDFLPDFVNKIYKNYSSYIHKNQRWSGLTEIAEFLNKQVLASL